MSGVREAVELSCPPESRLAEQINELVDTYARHPGWLSHRRFALDVAGSLGVDPQAAAPVSVVSTLWWAAAETLDDFLDRGRGSPTQLVAAVSCGTVVVDGYVEQQDEAVRERWRRECALASAAAAEGQLADLARDESSLSWRAVMRAYAGKTGAPYGRDAAMVAALSTSDDEVIGSWRSFGRIFGVLRQLHNATPSGDDDEDVANGTPTLRLAHALSAADPIRRAELLRARALARHDPAARQQVYELLGEPETAAGYRSRVAAIHAHACRLLDSLTPHGQALRARLDETAVLACAT